MHQRGGAFNRLHQIGRESIAQQRGHGAIGLQISCGDLPPITRLPHHHAAQPLLQIRQITREAEHRHDFGSNGDVKPIFARETIGNTAQGRIDAAQRAIIHVNRAAPGNAARIQAKFIAPIDVVIQHRRQQIIGAGDGVEIPGEMQIDIFHRQHLRITAAGRPTLHAKAGTKGWFAQADHGARAERIQRITKTNGGGGFALTSRGWVDAGDQHQGAIRAVCLGADEIQPDLGLVFAVGFQRIGRNAGPRGDIRNRLQRRGARDIKIRCHFSLPLAMPPATPWPGQTVKGNKPD